MATYEMVLILFAVFLGLVALAFWGWMAVHCLRNGELSTENRLLWLVAILCGKLLGAGAYYFVRYRPQASAAPASSRLAIFALALVGTVALARLSG